MLLGDLLLSGDGALGALARKRVNLHTLTAHGQAAAVAEAAVAADVRQAFTMAGKFTAAVAFDVDPAVAFDVARSGIDIAVGAALPDPSAIGVRLP